MTFSERSQITSDFEVQQRWRRAGGATLITFLSRKKQAWCRRGHSLIREVRKSRPSAGEVSEKSFYVPQCGRAAGDAIIMLLKTKSEDLVQAIHLTVTGVVQASTSVRRSYRRDTGVMTSYKRPTGVETSTGVGTSLKHLVTPSGNF